ncbi:MAG: large conductance mechanosensitive channel protein MscL, partial [Acidimicrobiales bacterium]
MPNVKRLGAEFKDFILRGNVVDLAVAVVIALYFGPIIKDLVSFILNILAIAGKHTSFQDLAFHIRGGTFAYGQLITDIITFLIVAAAVFFLVVRPIGWLQAIRQRRGPDPDSTTRPCPECLSDIPKAATRCAFCTAVVPAIPEMPVAQAPPPAGPDAP